MSIDNQLPNLVDLNYLAAASLLDRSSIIELEDCMQKKQTAFHQNRNASAENNFTVQTFLGHPTQSRRD